MAVSRYRCQIGINVGRSLRRSALLQPFGRVKLTDLRAVGEGNPAPVGRGVDRGEHRVKTDLFLRPNQLPQHFASGVQDGVRALPESHRTAVAIRQAPAVLGSSRQSDAGVSARVPFHAAKCKQNRALMYIQTATSRMQHVHDYTSIDV